MGRDAVTQVREDTVSGAKGLYSSSRCQARGRRKPQDTVGYRWSSVATSVTTHLPHTTNAETP